MRAGTNPRRKRELKFIRYIVAGAPDAVAAAAAGFHYNSGWRLRQRLQREIAARQRGHALDEQRRLGWHHAAKLIDAVLVLER